MRTDEEPPPPDGWPNDRQERIEAGATLYGRRSNGAYVAYSKNGEQVLEEPEKDRQEMPTLFVLARPNGRGKSTLTTTVLFESSFAGAPGRKTPMRPRTTGPASPAHRRCCPYLAQAKERLSEVGK